MIPPLHEASLKDYCGGIITTGTIKFGLAKDALSAGASSMIIRPTGEEFYSRYIQWSIIDVSKVDNNYYVPARIHSNIFLVPVNNQRCTLQHAIHDLTVLNFGSCTAL